MYIELREQARIPKIYIRECAVMATDVRRGKSSLTPSTSASPRQSTGHVTDLPVKIAVMPGVARGERATMRSLCRRRRLGDCTCIALKQMNLQRQPLLFFCIVMHNANAVVPKHAGLGCATMLVYLISKSTSIRGLHDLYVAYTFHAKLSVCTH